MEIHRLNPGPFFSQLCYFTLSIQLCPKKGINPTILLWGWDWDHQTYSREGYGCLVLQLPWGLLCLAAPFAVLPFLQPALSQRDPTGGWSGLGRASGCEWIFSTKTRKRSSRWWFQIFLIFIPTWGDDLIWLIFFRWVGTTNQSLWNDFGRIWEERSPDTEWGWCVYLHLIIRQNYWNVGK